MVVSVLFHLTFVSSTVCFFSPLSSFVLRPSSSVLLLRPWTAAVDCLDPTCSNNGICVNGECHCKPGWGGLHCELPRAQCPDQCHGHGAFIPDTGLCSCDPNWMGPDCSMGECGVTPGVTPGQLRRFTTKFRVRGGNSTPCVQYSVLRRLLTRPRLIKRS